MAYIIKGDDITSGEFINYDLIDDGPIYVTYSIDKYKYIRNENHLELPEPNIGEEVIYMLIKIYDNDYNNIAFLVQGDYEVDWGDGNIIQYDSGDIARKGYNFNDINVSTQVDNYRQVIVTITPNGGNLTLLNLDVEQSSHNYYNKPGLLEIKMSGPNITSLSISNDNQQTDTLKSFEFYGSNNITNMNSLFQSMNHLEKVKLDCSNSISTSFMFNGCIRLKECLISNLGNSNDMTLMFNNCRNLLVFPTIDATSCTNMYGMFRYCASMIETPDILNAGGVLSNLEMFNECSSLQFIKLFDTSSSLNMEEMFRNCVKIQSIPLFDTSNVQNTNSMFSSCFSMQFIPKLDLSSVTTATYMFNSCYSLISDDRTQGIPNLDFSSLTNALGLFSNCINIKKVSLSNMTNNESTSYMFNNCRNLLEVDLFDTSSVTNMSFMFNECISLKQIPLYDTSNVVNMESMFENCNELRFVPALDTSSVTNMDSMFFIDYDSTNKSYGSLREMPDFDTSLVTNMTNMFRGQSNLKYINNYNTSNVTNMSNMFYQCESIQEYNSHFDLSSVENTSSMFFRCKNLRYVNGMNMPLNQSISSLFAECVNLIKVDNITTTSNLLFAASCFRLCYNLKEISFFDVSGVSNFFRFMANCRSIEYIPDFVTSSATYFREMFDFCYNLIEIPDTIDSSGVTDMNDFAYSCKNLKNIPTMDVSNLTSLQFSFMYCDNLQYATFSGTGSSIFAYGSFRDCFSLKSVHFDDVSINYYREMFNGCYNLESVGTFSVLPQTSTTGGGNSMFRLCRNLKNIDINFDTSLNRNFDNMFRYCESLIEIPFLDMSESVNGDSTFIDCYNLNIINATNSSSHISLSRTNIDLNSFSTFVDNLDNADSGALLDIKETGIQPELMDINNRSDALDKGYQYETGNIFDELKVYYPFYESTVYNGSGTIVSDISGYNYPTPSDNDGTLVNSPSFNTNNFTFNGVDQIIDLGDDISTLGENVTLFAVVEPVTIQTGTVSIIGRYGTNSSNYFLELVDGKPRFGFYDEDNIERDLILNYDFIAGERYFISVYYNGLGNANFWINNKQITSLAVDNMNSQTPILDNSTILSIAGDAYNNDKYANIILYSVGVKTNVMGSVYSEHLYAYYNRIGLI
jgi:surface protein